MRCVKEKYTMISTQNHTSNVTYYIQVCSAGRNNVALKPLDWWLKFVAGNTNATVILVLL